jgi:DNA gyrase/topoisomerase IV subunit A
MHKIMDEIEIEKEIIHEIDHENELKDKLQSLERIYEAIQKENQNYKNKYNGLRISELSRIAGPLHQTISQYKSELKPSKKMKTVLV